VQTIQIARQQVITKDNVPVSIDAALFFRVDSASDAVIKVQDFRFAISQYARTSLRDVIGQMTLDQLLAEREQIESAIAKHVETDTDGRMGRVAERVFAVLSRNAANPSDFFDLPPSRVVEVGARIDL
jgi:regulator of protease activity HflC (stomatin/prohibitin superfamily)